uniref:AAA+ ATPase domain-containing protein n=1 Tax=Oryza nivara TaxID=4536 RepID=A0A0E0INT0_ORYNI
MNSLLKQAAYPFNIRRNVQDLITHTDDLVARRHDIARQIEAADRDGGMIPTHEARQWLDRVESARLSADTIRGRYEQRCRMFGGCSLNLWSNYRISKRAAERLAIVRSYEVVPSPITIDPPTLAAVNILIESVQIHSQESILEEALRCITEGPSAIIGICGPGGVGKTHLLKRINNNFVGDSTFRLVIFVTATRGCSVQTIQTQIMERINLNRDGDSVTRANRIVRFLKAKSFLLLVDDLWGGELEMGSVGIPYPLKNEGQLKQKVVITTRSPTICELMNVTTHVKVEVLEDDEARELFMEYNGHKGLYSDPHIGDLAKELVKELKGVASQLIHFGKEMRGRKDPKRWEDAIFVVKTSDTTHLQDEDQLSLKGTIVRNLKVATENMLARSNEVRQKIEIAERNGKTPTNGVISWLRRVDSITSSAEIICGQHQLNLDVSQSAAEKLHEVQECLDNQPSDIVVDVLQTPTEYIPIQSFELRSQNIVLQDALRYIADDSVEMIGIRGAAGVGKTHILKKINNSFHEHSDFQFVIFVTASRNIREQIARRLGINQDDRDAKLVTRISKFLEKRSFLLLVDDLREILDPKEAGIPFPLRNSSEIRQKVVFTTRSEHICGQMAVSKKIKVTCLEQDEAIYLFRQNVDMGILHSSPRIEELANTLAKELSGLPLALITTARAMSSRHHPTGWEDAIREMHDLFRHKDNPLNMEKGVYQPIKFSYDSLRNDTLKQCFLTCSMWPVDQNIRKDELVQCWMGLGLVDEPNIRSSYNEAYKLICDLEAACLLESGPNNDVKMQNVIRDTALWISHGKWVVHTGRNSLDANIARVIQRFIAVTYLDLSWNKLENIPEELCSLTNLEYLNLSYNFSISEVPKCLGFLIKLKFLYLQGTNIKTIPDGVISSLTELQVLDLLNMYFGEGITMSPVEYVPTILPELGAINNLKEVDIVIEGSFQYELLSQCCNLPLRLVALRKMEQSCALFRLSESIFQDNLLGTTLNYLEVSDSDMNVIEIFRGAEAPNYCFEALKKIELFNLKMLKHIKCFRLSPHDMFPSLSVLRVSFCDRLKNISCTMYLSKLQHLEVSYCNSITQAFGHNMNKSTVPTFPCLRYLSFAYLDGLEKICDSDVTFPQLETLKFTGCPNLMSLPFKKGTVPLNLRELQLEDVKLWKNLIWEEEGVLDLLEPYLKIKVSPPTTCLRHKTS